MSNHDGNWQPSSIAYSSANQAFRVRIIPTEIHDVHQRWKCSSTTLWGINGSLNQQEALLLAEGSGTTPKKNLYGDSLPPREGKVARVCYIRYHFDPTISSWICNRKDHCLFQLLKFLDIIARVLKEYLGLSCLRFNGTIDKNEKHNVQESFKADERNILLITSGAGSVPLLSLAVL